jgi:sensor histidine kinase YesM
VNVWRLLAMVAAGLFVGLVALLFLHHTLKLQTALWAVVLSGGVTLLVRRIWWDLPGFVTSWLDVGVLVVGVLVICATTGFTNGVPFAVLRWPRAVALLSAAGLLSTAIAGLAYTHRRLEVEVREGAERLAEARRRALESRLTALSAQINPHFLFNTLNTLAEVVHEDEDEAEDLVADLAAMMRYALDSSATRVPLEKEFDMVRRLLRIESARLQERLSWTLELDPSVKSARIPGLLIQPIVENAVQHGVARHAVGGRVSVRAKRVDGEEGPRLHIVVEDDGPGLPDAVKETLYTQVDSDVHPGGLRNVVERVRLAWPDRPASVTLDAWDGGTRFIYDLPLDGLEDAR